MSARRRHHYISDNDNSVNCRVINANDRRESDLKTNILVERFDTLDVNRLLFVFFFPSTLLWLVMPLFVLVALALPSPLTRALVFGLPSCENLPASL